MTDKRAEPKSIHLAEMIHLPKRRSPKSLKEQIAENVELQIAGHFREQNDLLRSMNAELGSQVRRLTQGIEQLVTEMHGVRTGKREEAFARIGPSGASPDLPTVCADAALIYTLTSEDIGQELAYHSSQIGILLSHRGLKWAGNGDYQEIGRHKKKSQQKFWHRDVPKKLRVILDSEPPSKYNITDKYVLAIFKRWPEKKAAKAFHQHVHKPNAPH